MNDASFRHDSDSGLYNDIMTLEGTVSKSIYLVGILLTSGILSWKYAHNAMVSDRILELLQGAAILAFVVALITIFKKSWSPTTVPAYAVLEGVSLGWFSHLYDTSFAGIVLQAILLTVAVFIILLFLYRSRVILPSENLKLGVVSATGGILLLYILNFAGGFIGWQIPYLHESGPIGILISVVIVIVAALNLVIDFDFIEKGADRRLPKYMEWYGAFGLLVTLVWLYLEILRLLAKLREN